MATGDSPSETRNDATRVDQHSVDGSARAELSSYFAESTAKTEKEPPADQGSFANVAGTFVRSLAFSALQTPIDGLTQLVNGAVHPIIGRQAIPRLQLVDAPNPTEFGSAEWTARLAGGGIGTILPFYFGGKAAVRMAKGASGVKYLGPLIERAGILEENSIAQLAFKGGVYEGVFHPVDESAGNFAGQRAINFASGALSFMALGYANQGLRGTRLGQLGLNSGMRAVPFSTELLMDATSGATAGVTDSVIHSLANGDAPNASALTQSAGEYALMSMFLRLGRLPIEKAAKQKPPTIEEKAGTTDATTAQTEAAKAESLDNLNLRPTLPFDKLKIRQAVLPNGEAVEVIGIERGNGRSVVYRNVPEAVDAPRMRVTAEEYEGGTYQTVHHKGQEFAISPEGKAYAVNRVDGAYELVLTDKIILERLNEVQVPWPPIQSNDRYKTGDVIRLNDMFALWTNSLRGSPIVKQGN